LDKNYKLRSSAKKWNKSKIAMIVNLNEEKNPDEFFADKYKIKLQLQVYNDLNK
jgi:hypothetical protein